MRKVRTAALSQFPWCRSAEVEARGRDQPLDAPLSAPARTSERTTNYPLLCWLRPSSGGRSAVLPSMTSVFSATSICSLIFRR